MTSHRHLYDIIRRHFPAGINANFPGNSQNQACTTGCVKKTERELHGQDFYHSFHSVITCLFFKSVDIFGAGSLDTFRASIQ